MNLCMVIFQAFLRTMLGENRLFCPYDSEAFVWNTEIPFIWRSRKIWGRSRKTAKFEIWVFSLPWKSAESRVELRDSYFERWSPGKSYQAVRKRAKECVCACVCECVWNWTKEWEGAKSYRSERDLEQISLGFPRWVSGDRWLEEAGCLGKGPEIGTAWGVLWDSLWGWDHGS